MTDTNTAAEALGMLPITCDRKGKTVNVHMPVSAMTPYLATMAARTKNGSALIASLEAIPDGQTPDLVVIFKGQAFVLPTIPDDAKQDLAIKRALNTALGADATGRTFFPVPEPTPRGDKKTAAKDEVAS